MRIKGTMKFLGVLAAIALLSGCATTQSAAPSGSSTGTTSSCVATVKKNVTASTAAIEPTFPQGDVKVSKGGTVMFLGSTLANAAVARVNSALQQAAQSVGWNETSFDGQASPDRYVEGVEQAVAQKVNALIIYGVPITVIEKPLADAKAAGIAVVTISTGFPASGAVSTALNFDPDMGKILADALLAKTDCKLNGLFAYDTSFAIHAGIYHRALAEVKAMCPKTCKLNVQTFQVANIATKLESDTTALLQRDPSINGIIAAFDAAAFYQAKAIMQLGSNVTLVAQNGEVANIQLIRDKQGQYGDAGVAPYEYQAYLAFDAALRHIAGEKVPADYKLPVQLFVPDTVPQNVTTATLFPKFVGFQSGFTSHWKS